RLEDHRHRPVIEPEPAPFAPDMRAEQPRPTPELDELEAQFLGRPVCGLPDIVLIGQDLFAHKTLGLFLQLDEIVGQRKIHRCLPESWWRASSGLPSGSSRPRQIDVTIALSY